MADGWKNVRTVTTTGKGLPSWLKWLFIFGGLCAAGMIWAKHGGALNSAGEGENDETMKGLDDMPGGGHNYDAGNPWEELGMSEHEWRQKYDPHYPNEDGILG